MQLRSGGTKMKSVASMLTGLALLGMSAAPSWAQEHAQDYPNRQVNFVVPFAPGGGTDILGRLVGQKLSDRFGKPFVIENRPGAGTVTAAVQVATSTPDGYTIMMATSGTLAMNPTLYKKLPYDAGKTMRLPPLISNVPSARLVQPSQPVHS